MAVGFNNFTATGHMGRDVELSNSQGGALVARFSIALNKYIPGRSGSEGSELTMWLNVTAFGKLAEYFERFAHKGDLVIVSGEFWPRDYTDRSGAARVSYDLTANAGRVLATNLPHGKQPLTEAEKSAGEQGAQVDPFLPDFPD